jgi:hypothetical protein
LLQAGKEIFDVSKKNPFFASGFLEVCPRDGVATTLSNTWLAFAFLENAQNVLLNLQEPLEHVNLWEKLF